MKTSRSPRTAIEQLEARIAPAVVITPSKVTFTDLDGDVVIIKSSKAVLDQGGVLTFAQSLGAATNQLQILNLGVAAEGAQISITATTPAGGFGDGFVNVGAIHAAGVNLASVLVKGDLGKILVGNNSPQTAALGKLVVGSLGRLGLSTQAMGVDLVSVVQGNMGGLSVLGDVSQATFDVVGSLKTLNVGGSLIGGSASNSGEIDVSGSIGIAKVAGNLIGGVGIKSGRITAGANLTALTVGGSVFGGDGLRSGEVHTDGSMGSVLIKGDLKGGSGKTTGRVDANASIKSLTLLGSLVGTKHDETGEIRAGNNIGTLKIGGNILGGDADASTQALNIMDTGYVQADRIGTVVIGGSIIAGVDDSATCVLSNSGAIRTSDDIGSLKVLGSLIGNQSAISGDVTYATISGEDSAFHDNTPASDVVLGSVFIGGTVQFGLIQAGYNTSGIAVDGDAKIGSVVVKGDWISSSLVAGVQSTTKFFGDLSDVVIPIGFPDNFSRIASITIGGQVFGSVGGSDVFAFQAQSIGKFKIGGTTVPLTSGVDSFLISPATGSDVRVRELA